MNKYQKHYALAKANLEALEEAEAKSEQQYILEHGIVNADGGIPERIYCIDDNETFEAANIEHAAQMDASGEWADILTAREVLKQAENMLIAYGLSIAPAEEREVLTQAAKTNYTTRCKIIDLVMRLDTRTVQR